MKRSRKGHILVTDGYRYQKHKVANDMIHWRCWRPNCRSKTKTNTFDVNYQNQLIRVLARAANHNHADDAAITERNQFRQTLQQEAARDPTRPPRRIYNAEVGRIQRAQGGDRPVVPSFGSVRTSVQRSRSANIPPVPHDVDEVQIEGA